ncbi:protein-disulfide reductase DsbD domain-containing protein [uncultured Roseobacter sp.]|uniref:protein-disulfide reductase DsbD domain-containing protein n=1 Tax=uncultured Roseobacter sp. TaxID=114847 RepID=UPI00261342F9|nr:protein-disulfide reductase DsbD domain-containing protein [uncultured Roseobacter sp.]
MKHLLFVLMLGGLAALPAWAQDRFAVPVTAEVLQGWVQRDGTRMSAVHMDLQPGWKTYWRAPGDAGIPPSFDWSGSRNLHSVAISWPKPKVFDDNGMRSIGYSDTLVIPLSLTPKQPGEPVRVRLTMDIGVCADICIPHRLEFDQMIDTDRTRPTPAIAAALAQSPYSAREAGVTSSRCRIEPTSDGLRIEARVGVPHTGGTEVMVIEPGLPEVWVSESHTHRKGGDVIATSEMIHVNGGTIAIDRSAIRLTVLGSNHAVDVRGCTPG